MFTGIITATGTLQSSETREGDLRFCIDAPAALMKDARVGDSVSVSGVCLTMLEPFDSGFSADLSLETLDCTSLGNRQVGDHVNLELALQVGDRLGGHMVSGHVDGLAKVIERQSEGRSERFDFEIDPSLARFVAAKGSVCLDGVSLTVNEVDNNRFSVNIIPHTLEVTTLGQLQTGQMVNFEIDLIARYLERLSQYA